MQVELSSRVDSQSSLDWLVLPLAQDGLSAAASPWLGDAAKRRIAQVIEAGDFVGKPGELTRILGLEGGSVPRVLLLGLGPVEGLGIAKLTRAVMTAVRDLTSQSHRAIAVALPDCDLPGVAIDQATRAVVTAIRQGSESQQLYRAQPDRNRLASAKLLVAPERVTPAVSAAVESGNILGEAVNLTRELVNRHPGEVYPETLADRAAQVAAECGLHCEIFDEPRLRRERMGSLLGVAQGSTRPPRMVVLEHRGGPAGQAPLAFVGKGVTFDSGGLSLKPSDGMKTMKGDMAGSATVLAAMSAISRLKLPVNVLGFMGCVENMPSGSSFKLGEVLTARNGVTIEVMNTDAEGRLVLADVLSYAVDRGVAKIVDLATLTGSCVIALGDDVAGAFTNNQPWCDDVLAAARRAGEEVWQMPMFDAFAEQLRSEVADCKNIGTRAGGSITAAKFLEKFVGNVPWVHLDIAGPAFAENPKPYLDGGGTGVLVRTLVELASAAVGTK
jgi:leucyl aminopeptidase